MKMAEGNIPWTQAVSLSVDNTNSMIGAHNSFASCCKAQNPDIYVHGCPCHLAHITASNANDAFTAVACKQTLGSGFGFLFGGGGRERN